MYIRRRRWGSKKKVCKKYLKYIFFHLECDEFFNRIINLIFLCVCGVDFRINCFIFYIKYNLIVGFGSTSTTQMYVICYKRYTNHLIYLFIYKRNYGFEHWTKQNYNIVRCVERTQLMVVWAILYGFRFFMFSYRKYIKILCVEPHILLLSGRKGGWVF